MAIAAVERAPLTAPRLKSLLTSSLAEIDTRAASGDIRDPLIRGRIQALNQVAHYASGRLRGVTGGGEVLDALRSQATEDVRVGKSTNDTARERRGSVLHEVLDHPSTPDSAR